MYSPWPIETVEKILLYSVLPPKKALRFAATGEIGTLNTPLCSVCNSRQMTKQAPEMKAF